MSDLIDLLRAHDPERGGTIAPPIEPLLARLDDSAASPSAADHARRARRARSVAFLLAGALAAAAIAAVIVIATGVTGGKRSRATVVPGAGDDGPVIIHMVTRNYFEDPDGRHVRAYMQDGHGHRVGTMDGIVERWATASPPRSRQLMHFKPGPGMPGGFSDETYDGPVHAIRTSWDRGVRTDRTPANAVVVPETPSTRLLNGTEDSVDAVRDMLASGEARRDGETTRDGRRLLRLVATTPVRRHGRRGVQPATRTVYLFDAKTLDPVEIDRVMVMPKPRKISPALAKRLIPLRGGGYAGPTNRTVFEQYERIPLTAKTEHLLELGGGR
jgi:hypothetical protein